MIFEILIGTAAMLGILLVLTIFTIALAFFIDALIDLVESGPTLKRSYLIFFTPLIVGFIWGSYVAGELILHGN